MEKQADSNIGSFVHRRMSQVKVLSRVLEHELSSAKGADLTLDRSLVENVLDTIEIFVEDFEIARGGKAQDKRVQAEAKPAVTRLN